MQESFVLDNSVVMSWCFKDKSHPYADSILDRLAKAAAYVPSVWPLEVVNVLLVAERKKCISEAGSIRFIDLLSQLPIHVEQGSPEEAMRNILGLARAHKLSSYDAVYLDLAMKKGLPLATLDKKLRHAAESVNVSVLK